MAFINRGDNTGAFGTDFLRIYLNNPNNLYIQKAVFQVNGCLEKEFWEPQFPLRVNFTGEETQMLHDVNHCKLALWDEHGRRRTAEGKFTFFVRENKIKEPDSPDTYIDDTPIPDITFDLSDAEFNAQFSINASPSKMSELENDINILLPENIKPGRNTQILRSGNDIIINADIIGQTSYNDLTDKPTINGILIKGDITLPQKQVDWNELDTESELYIKNKPNISKVGKSNNYEDLDNKPDIPNKLSQLDNDCEFITGENYYNKDEVNSLINHDIDLEPINNRITSLENEHEQDVASLQEQLDEKISEDKLNVEIGKLQTVDDNLESLIDDKVNQINSKLEQKATKEELNEVSEYIHSVISQEDLNDALSIYVKESNLGNGTLSISTNGILKGTFNANAKNDKTIDLPIPTKISDLSNDLGYVRAIDINIDDYIDLDTLNNRLSEKLDISDLGTGILTIQINGENKGSFNANESNNKTINLSIPTKISDLTQDISYLKSNDLNSINTQLGEIETYLGNIPTQLSTLQENINKKLDASNTKSLVDNTEINRLRNVDNYDDTEIKESLSSIQNIVNNIDYDISNKVNKVEGKSLSTNDFTDEYKNDVEANKVRSLNNSQNIQALTSSINNLNDVVPELQLDVNGLNTALSNESLQRLNTDNELQSQIDALQAKSTVIDLIPNHQALEQYNTDNLMINDVICVLNDETVYNTVTYYRWTKDPIDNSYAWTFIGSEGRHYTIAEADNIFVNKQLKINDKSLTSDITLTCQDIGALPDNTLIGNGTVVIQINGSDLQAFNLNDEDNTVINIPIPISLSELSNTETRYLSEDVLLQNYLGTNIPEDTLIQDEINHLQTQINKNATDIATLSGNLPAVVLSGSYDDLLDLPTKISDLKNHNSSTDTTAYIDSIFIQELTNKADYLTNQSFEDTLSTYALKTEIPKAVSELENDRGYITANALGKGSLSIKMNDELLGVFNANDKNNLEVVIPIDSTLSSTSVNSVQNKVIKNELDLKANNNDVMHLQGDEIINGNKTFNNLNAITKPNTESSNAVATTQYVKNQGYAIDANVIHKSDDETINGNKTFTGLTSLSEATGITVSSNDNSNNLATTKFVKDQGYAIDSRVVHDGGDEVINGNKTFAETTTFQGITNLGDYAHVTTPDGNTLDAVTNVQYVLSQIQYEAVTILNTVYTKSESDTRYLTSIPSHVHEGDDIILNEYVKGSIQGNIYSTDTVSQALSKIENNLDAINASLQLLQQRVQNLEDRLDSLTGNG